MMWFYFGRKILSVHLNEGEMKIILSNGKHTFIDKNMIHLRDFKWSEGTKGYPQRSFKDFNGKLSTMFLHHAIIGHPLNSKSLVIDHINGNKLDNRIKNLRIVTPRENQWNTKKRRDGKCDSKYPGVHKFKGKWIAQMSINNTVKHIGYFSKERDAANAYLNAISSLKK